MKALFTLTPANKKAIIYMTLLSTVFWIYPEALLASSLQATGTNSAQVFEIKIANLEPISPTPTPNNNQNSLSIQTVQENNPLTKKLKAYLEKNNSPMAEEAKELIQYEQWQRGLAIAFVESNFCSKALNKNCTSIGVAPGHKLWRKYQTYSEWMADMSALMEKPIYKDRYNSFAKMKGVYVQPGSWNWVYGAQQKYNELMQLTAEAEAESRLLAEKHTVEVAALTTFPENTN